jgi:uncharacterized membrane protein YeaQ/YmgE (transglycosylase-associated protein family)
LAVFALLVIVFVILPIIGWAIGLVIWTAVVGAILGALGRLIVPGRQPIGFLATICCGWAGAIIGGIIGRGAHLHRLATLLVEVGLAAAAVALWSGQQRRQVGGSRRGVLSR